MLLTRVITAVVLLIVLTLSIYIGPLAFAGVMAVTFGATLFEWLRIGGLGPRPALLVAAVEMVVQFSLYWAGALDRMAWFLFIVNGIIMVAWFVIFFAELFHRQTGFKVSQRQCLWSAVTFVPAAYLSLLWLYELGDWILVLSVLLIVWGADISAYFCGRAWGKHPMAPAISPKKTLEGALGAYVIVIIFFALTYVFCTQQNVFTNYLFDNQALGVCVPCCRTYDGNRYRVVEGPTACNEHAEISSELALGNYREEDVVLLSMGCRVRGSRLSSER